MYRYSMRYGLSTLPQFEERSGPSITCSLRFPHRLRSCQGIRRKFCLPLPLFSARITFSLHRISLTGFFFKRRYGFVGGGSGILFSKAFFLHRQPCHQARRQEEEKEEEEGGLPFEASATSREGNQGGWLASGQTPLKMLLSPPPIPNHLHRHKKHETVLGKTQICMPSRTSSDPSPPPPQKKKRSPSKILIGEISLCVSSL